MSRTEVQRINDRGLARGWHAQMLQLRAQRTGRTMADLHHENIRGAAAFNVPGECVAIRGGLVHYRFLDGSVTSHIHQKREDR